MMPPIPQTPVPPGSGDAPKQTYTSWENRPHLGNSNNSEIRPSEYKLKLFQFDSNQQCIINEPHINLCTQSYADNLGNELVGNDFIRYADNVNLKVDNFYAAMMDNFGQPVSNLLAFTDIQLESKTAYQLHGIEPKSKNRYYMLALVKR